MYRTEMDNLIQIDIIHIILSFCKKALQGPRTERERLQHKNTSLKCSSKTPVSTTLPFIHRGSTEIETENER
jgi:hypothetical protein